MKLEKKILFVINKRRSLKSYKIFKINKRQMDQVLNYCDVGVIEGATRECGGCRYGETGYYVTPTVFSNVTDDMKIAREEVAFLIIIFYVCVF